MTNGKYLTRRQLFGQTTYGIGAAALAALAIIAVVERGRLFQPHHAAS